MGIFKMEDFHIRSAIEANLDTIQEFQENKGPLLTGVPTGFSILDQMTSGLNSGDLILLASCRYMGKTAFALNITRNVAVENKMPVLIFSWINTREQLSLRMLCTEAQVESSRAKSGELGNNDRERLKKAGEVLSDAPIYIDDTSGNAITDVELMATDFKENGGISMIIIDYLQLITSDLETPNRRMELFEILEVLKYLAETLDIPVMVLYQLNADIIEREDHRPDLIDLADAGSFDQSADLVLFIYRDEVYQILKDGSNIGLAQIIVAKNRHGSTGMVTLRFIRQFGLFKDFRA